MFYVTLSKISYLNQEIILPNYYLLSSFWIKSNVKNPVRSFSAAGAREIDLTTRTPKLEPWFVIGFTDAEGCFSFSLLTYKENLKILFRFHIGA